MLEAWLDFHRATIALKCSGPKDDQSRLPAASPSSMTPFGLVRHMAEVERNDSAHGRLAGEIFLECSSSAGTEDVGGVNRGVVGSVCVGWLCVLAVVPHLFL
ncbi:mycothiol transferase [Streptomyces flavalbus]|uniref:DUF664 domain-containing protein n=1 Tax=Streptomyces flavalbus TaxID=2665155 RepID=A0ABW2WI91_9ACTN